MQVSLEGFCCLKRGSAPNREDLRVFVACVNSTSSLHRTQLSRRCTVFHHAWWHFLVLKELLAHFGVYREALSALPPSPQAFPNDSPPPPADPANPPGGSSATSGGENHSTSSSSSGSPGVPLGDAVGGLSTTEVTERGISNEAGSGYSHWLSFLWRRGTRGRDALNANIAAPFLSGAALVVEMRMMRTETLPA